MSVFKRYNGTTWEIAGVGITDHTYLTSIGTNTHAQIDSTLAALSTTYSPIAGPGSSQTFAVGGLTATSLTVNTNTLVTNSSGNVLIGTSTDSGLSKLQVTNGITLGNSNNTNGTVLDWYEEGTFTPVLYGLTTAGVGTYMAQTGRYTRIGNVVAITLALSWTAHTGTGSMRISGLPFAAASLSPLSVRYSNLAVGSGKALCCSTNISESTIYMLSQDAVGGVENAIAMDKTGTVYITGTYFV